MNQQCVPKVLNASVVYILLSWMPGLIGIMSKELKYKQATNVERRVWDKEAYAAKAKARANQAELPLVHLHSNHESLHSIGEKRPLNHVEQEEFVPAVKNAPGPERSDRAFLKARRQKVDMDSKVGSTQIVSAELATKTSTGIGKIGDDVTKTGVGWHCKVCDCFLKDSHTYLDHINGRKHQRKLGYSMRVERSTKDQVKERLDQLLKEREQAEIPVESKSPADIVKAKDEEVRKLKEDRKKRREERKKKVEVQDGDQDEEAEQIDPDIAAIMGFSGFGGSSTKK